MTEPLKLKDVTPIDDEILEAFNADGGMRLALRAVYELGRAHQAMRVPMDWKAGDTHD